MAVSLPVVLLVLDLYPLHRLGGKAGWPGRARQVLIEKLPFILLAAATGAVAVVAMQTSAVSGVLVSARDLDLAGRAAVSAYGLAFYLWKTVAPIGLSPIYELRLPVEILEGRFLASGAVVLLLTVAAVSLRRQWPALLAVWVTYVATLLPVLGIVQNGPQIAADRYSYLACVGWLILAGAALSACWRGRTPWAKLVALPIAALLVTGSGVLTWQHLRVWRDSETLWSDAVAIEPSALAHTNLGTALAERRDLDGAVEQFERALRLNPRYTAAHYNLGVARAQVGMWDRAIDHYRQGLRFDARHAKLHYNLAVALGQQGHVPEAVEHYREALRIDPTYAKAHYNLGAMLARQDMWAEATEHFSRAVRIQPAFAEARQALDAARIRLGMSPGRGSGVRTEYAPAPPREK
jgi:tetratricopeptide (TPR) repeat protein